MLRQHRANNDVITQVTATFFEVLLLICQDTSTSRQQKDLYGLRVKLPPDKEIQVKLA